MKKGRAAMWVRLETVGALALAFGLGLLPGCGQTDERESGETHFLLTCSGETCGPGLECLCGVCSKPCDADRDCSSLGKTVTCVEHDGATCETVTKSCDVECSGDADCVAVGAEHRCQADYCRAPGSGNPSGPLACESGCGDAMCFTPGSCTLQAACALEPGTCGGPVVDETACLRASCESDDTCLDTERCTFAYVGRKYDCQQVGNQCACTSGLGLFPMQVCSPISLVGARGAWQELALRQNVIGDETAWVVTPDGAVTKTLGELQGGGTTMLALSESDLQQLRELIDGPSLRVALSDPEPCPIAKSRDDLVTLTLDTQTLEKNVTGCLSTVGAYDTLVSLLSQY